MLRTLTLSLLALTLFASGCKKSDPEVDRFVINGLHDISFNSSSSGNILTLEIKQMNGTQENVTLSVENLPSGTSAVIEPSGGVPTFAAAIRFIQTGPVKGGSYPIRVIGKSASSIKTYDLNMVIPSSAVRIETMDSVDLAQYPSINVNLVMSNLSTWAEQTTLTVNDLPAGLDAEITNPTGKPNFNATVRFIEKSLLPEGIYPIKLRATAASSDTTKTVFVKVGPWSGVSADGKSTRAILYKNSSSGFAMYVNSNYSTRLVLNMSLGYTSLPETDGTYTYGISSNYANNRMSISYYPDATGENFTSIDQTVQVTVVRKNGKYSVKADNVVVKNYNGQSKTISIDAREL
jgi:hypothetical protein